MEIRMPENAKKVIETLEVAGYEAYIVGGCVRDSILGREPGDWDITTAARPEQVKALFRRTIDTGIKHGTVTVMFGKEAYEVTTYRVDGEYSDHRRPDSVEFTANLEEDLKRRDFTINAMAYSPSAGVIDLFGGMDDLDNKVIKAVGDPLARFDEDALRILRAIRFAGQLDFTIERDTRKAMILRAQFLQDISAERIRVELDKLLTSAHPEKLMEAYVRLLSQLQYADGLRCFMMWESRNVILWMKMVSTISMDIMRRGQRLPVRCFADCGLTMKRQIWYARWCCGMIMV